MVFERREAFELCMSILPLIPLLVRRSIFGWSGEGGVGWLGNEVGKRGRGWGGAVAGVGVGRGALRGRKGGWGKGGNKRHEKLN